MRQIDSIRKSRFIQDCSRHNLQIIRLIFLMVQSLVNSNYLFFGCTTVGYLIKLYVKFFYNLQSNDSQKLLLEKNK